jgi:transposase
MEPLDDPSGAGGQMSERHSMRKVREVLRLKYELGRSHMQIGTSVGMSRCSVDKYVKRAEAAGLSWQDAKEMSDVDVERLLFQHVGRNTPCARAPIDLGWVHTEMHKKGVTLQLLWTEYQEAVKDGTPQQRPYGYSQFCDLYAEFRQKLSPSMRQTHRAGEKAFIDFSGKKPRIKDPATGEVTEVELYVMVLGASSYTYAEATRTQGLADFVGATVRALEYFGGVPEMLVPDQLKSAVKRADWCEPEINATTAEMAQHYGTAVVPARPGKPKDKAKVEQGVLLSQRWILACLRNRTFFSLEELNAAIRERLEVLNAKPFKKLAGSRRTAFEALDRPALSPLPARRYELATWRLDVGVNIDYHVELEGRYYSVPCALIQEKVDLRLTATVVEIFRRGVRVASHVRSFGPKGTAVTAPEHRPRSHREFGEWPPERLIAWAGKAGASTAAVAEAILGRGPHVEAGRRACLALVRMGERYGKERLEAACERALGIGNPTRKSVEAILKSGLDRAAPRARAESKSVTHENIRGGAYFDRAEGAAAEPDDIEATYLNEERLAIQVEASLGPRPLAPVTPNMPRTVAELLEKLRPQWSRAGPSEPDGEMDPNGEKGASG